MDMRMPQQKVNIHISFCNMLLAAGPFSHRMSIAFCFSVSGDVYFDIQSIGARYGKFVGAMGSQGELSKLFCVRICCFLIINDSKRTVCEVLTEANNEAVAKPNNDSLCAALDKTVIHVIPTVEQLFINLFKRDSQLF